MKLLKIHIPYEVFESLSSRVPNGIYDEKEEIAIFPHDCQDVVDTDGLIVELRQDDVEVIVEVVEV